MERAEFKAMLDPLVLALRADFDLPTWTVYFRALEDVSPGLLAAAVAQAARTATFMPKPGELRTLCEKARQELLQAHPYTGCIDCEDSRGFQTITRQGVSFVQPCPCRERYRAKLAQMGVSATPLALPAARGGWEQVSE
jgi:hypothetical protein